MRKFSEKAFIVTGAGSGIGSYVAEYLAREGAALVLVDRNGEGLEKVAETVSAVGGICEIIDNDVTDQATNKHMVDICEDRFGRIDGFMPFAGIIRFADILDVLPEQWDLVLGINLRAVFFSTQFVARHMIDKGYSGSIVLVSSTSAHGPRPNNVEYGVSKSAIDYLTRTFALRLAAHDIRVNAISPGVVLTPMWVQVDKERGREQGLNPGEVTHQTIEKIPMKRSCKPEEIVGLVAFLVSDEAGYVTGQIIEIDGGFKLANI